MTKQDQCVGDDGEGYQAGRDLIVHKGMGAGEIAEIMVALAGQLQSYFADAETKAQERMADFKDEILKEFAKPDSVGNKEAFSDPDFQFVLRDAHQSFARSGDTGLRDELVRLVAQRSSAAVGTRTALILNRAIGIAGSLTEHEYAIILINFVFKNVKMSAQFPEQLSNILGVVLKAIPCGLPDSNHSLEYLESIGCLSINQFSDINLWRLLAEQYQWTYSKGFSNSELAKVGVADLSLIKPYISPMLNDFAGKVRFADLTEAELRTGLSNAGLATTVVDGLMALRQRGLASADDVREHLLAAVPAMAAVETCWSTTSLQKANLTALGKALGHSALVGKTPFRAPLDIWVR